MTTPDRLCPACRRPISDAGEVCHRCASHVQDWLQTVTVLLEQLEVTRTRQDVMVDAGPRTAPPTDLDDSIGVRLEWNDGAAAAAASVRITIGVYAARLLTDLGLDCQHGSCRRGAQPPCPGLAHTLLVERAPHVWLAAHRNDLRMRPWAGDAVRGCISAIKRGWSAVDRPEQRYYAGPCYTEMPDPERPDEDVLCGYVLWARLDQRVITCPGCRTRYSVIERREWLLRAAEDVLAPAPLIASALTLMTRRRVPASTIRSWAHRGILVRADDPPGPSPIYRVGDVVELLDRNEPTAEPEPTQEAS